MTWEDFEQRLIAHGYTTGPLRLKVIRLMRQRHPIVCDLNPPRWYELVVKDLNAGVVPFTSQALRKAVREQRARAAGVAVA